MSGAAVMSFDPRVAPCVGQVDLENEVKSAFESALKDTGAHASLEFLEGGLRWIAPSEVLADEPIVRAAIGAWGDVLGAEPVLGFFPGGNDVPLLTERGIPTLPAVGAGALWQSHGVDESVTVTDLMTSGRLYSLIVGRYLTAFHD